MMVNSFSLHPPTGSHCLIYYESWDAGFDNFQCVLTKQRNIHQQCKYEAESFRKRARVGLRNEAALLKIDRENRRKVLGEGK